MPRTSAVCLFPWLPTTLAAPEELRGSGGPSASVVSGGKGCGSRQVEDEPTPGRKGRGPAIWGGQSWSTGQTSPSGMEVHLPVPRLLCALAPEGQPQAGGPGRAGNRHQGPLPWVTGWDCSRLSGRPQNLPAAHSSLAGQAQALPSPQPAHLENGASGSNGATWARSSQAGRHGDALGRREARIKSLRAGRGPAPATAAPLPVLRPLDGQLQEATRPALQAPQETLSPRG